MRVLKQYSGHAAESGAETWAATRDMNSSPATEIMQTKEDYLGAITRDIGRRVNEQQHEWFVVCDPSEALRQQFEQSTPDFIVIHDIGSAASRRLVAGIAAGTGRKVQQLVIRRQGFGVVLATLEFAELPSANGQTLRVYTTQADADPVIRQRIARVMLAHSRLGVIYVGELTSGALSDSIRGLRDAIAAGPWSNRHLLLIPLAPAPSLAQEAAQITARSLVEVRTTAQVKRPTDGWGFVVEAWERLRDSTQVVPSRPAPARRPEIEARVDPRADASFGARSFGARPKPEPVKPEPEPPPPDFAPTTEATFDLLASIGSRSAPAAAPIGRPSSSELAGPPTSPLPFRHGPETGRAETNAPPPASPLAAFTQRCMSIHGTLGCCLFEISSRRSLTHSGSAASPSALAVQGEALLTAFGATGSSLGYDAKNPEALVSYGAHHVFVRAFAAQPGLAMIVVLDRQRTNIATAREQLIRIEAPQL